MNVFKERLKTGVERINLSPVGSQFHAQGWQQKTPSNRISDGSCSIVFSLYMFFLLMSLLEQINDDDDDDDYYYYYYTPVFQN